MNLDLIRAELAEQASWPTVTIPAWHPRNETPPVAAIPAEPPVAAAPPAAPVAPPNPGPWAADLAEYFPDEASRAAADRYMREKVQPSRTQLEAQLADPELAAARELYGDLTSDPRETLAAVATELFGEEFGKQFAGLFPDGTPAPPEAEPTDTIDLAKLPPEVRAIVERDQQAAAKAEYDTAVNGLIAGHADLTDEDLPYIHGHIASANGNLAAAAEMYIAQRTALAARYAPVDPAAAAAAAAVTGAAVPAPAPPVLGGTGAPAGGTPPAAPKKETLDEAIAGFLADQRAGAPPTVGTV